MVDVAHHRHHRWAAHEVIEVALLDHLDGLLRGLLDVVLKDWDTEFIGDGFDCLEIKSLGDRGDNPFEKQGFDDL